MSDGNWKIAFLVLPLVAMLSAPASVDAADNAGMEAQYKLPRATVSDNLAVARKTINVLDSRMAYLEVGEGEPVVFVHGKPHMSTKDCTSSRRISQTPLAAPSPTGCAGIDGASFFACLG